MKKLLPLIVFLCLTVPVFGQGFANGNGYNNGLTGGGNVGISTATALQSATTVVNVSAATAPTNGQVLTATGATAATWQTPSASGSNYWKLSTGNVGINTTYNVGIGSTNPGQALDVQGTIRTIGFSMGGVTSTTVTGTGANVFATSPTLTTPNLGTPSAINLSNATGTATNVSVGTASALNSATTIVSVSGAAAPTSGQVLTATGSTAATWQNSTGTNYWLINQAGNIGLGTTNINVGIGTLNPGQSLDVVGNGRFSGNIQTGTGGATITGFQGNVGIGSVNATEPLDVSGTVKATGFYLNMAPIAAGNVLVSTSVGIGTWMPSSTIPGTINSFTTTGSSGAATWTPGTGVLNVPQYSGGAGGFFIAANTGIGTTAPAVGIGTLLPSGALDVEGTITNAAFFANGASRTAGFGNVGIGTANPTALLEVKQAGAPYAFYANGNVGIGSLAPGQALDVQGTVRATGFILTGASSGTIVCNLNGALGHCTSGASCLTTCTCTCVVP